MFASLKSKVAVTVIGGKWHRYTGNKMYNRFGVSNGPIWLDNVRCVGTETDIDECSHNDWGVHNCQHREDVAVSCFSATTRTGMFSTSTV